MFQSKFFSYGPHISLSYLQKNRIEVYSQPNQTSKMELFTIMCNGWKLLTVCKIAPFKMFDKILNTPLLNIALYYKVTQIVYVGQSFSKAVPE